MATITPGPAISRIAGAAGSKVYSSWKGRAVVRAKSTNRANPSSPRQATARAGTTATSKAWNDVLTAEQKVLWEEAVQRAKDYIDPASSSEQGSRVVIPQPKPVLSGYDAFVRANQRLVLTGIRDIGDPVLTPGRASPCAPTNLVQDEAPPIPINFALDFDGINEDVTCANVLGYEYNQPQSWDFWFWKPAIADSPYIIAKMLVPALQGYQIWWGTNLLFWGIFDIPSGKQIYVTRAWTLFGQWVHVVVTYSGNNDVSGFKIYINSVVGQAPGLNVPIVGTIVTSAPLLFGSQGAAPSTFLEARMDCIRNYNRVLIQPEVDILFAGGAGLFGSNPFSDGSCQGSWAFCAGGGNTLFDISGNNYHGTLRNMEPVDWIPGKVPCPDAPGAKQLEWSDPDDLPVGGKIRVWCLSYDAGVHKQHVATIDRGVEAWIPTTVRVANGAEVPIANMPGHYLFQIDAISPNGNQSPPSNTIEAICPLV